MSKNLFILPSQKYLLLLILLAFSCSRKQAGKTHSVSETKYKQPIIVIEGINLSEDGTRLSSNNDELLVLIYEHKTYSGVSDPMFMTYIILDADKSKATVEVDSSLFEKDIIFTLIEVDTEKEISDIASFVGKNLSILIDAHQNQDRIAVNEILGDDDLLGIKKIAKENLSRPYAFKIQGVHKIDRFEYKINLYKQ